MGIRRGAVADDAAQHRFHCREIRRPLQHQEARALGHQEAVPVDVERP
jgi:hypothetical protein